MKNGLYLGVMLGATILLLVIQIGLAQVLISEVDPSSGEEVFAMNLRFQGAIAVSYRAFREASLPGD